MAISAIEKLRDNTSIIAGTGPRRRIVKLQPIYDALCESKVQAIGGCDTTGHIFETSKTSWWKCFFKSKVSVNRSFTALGRGSEPTEEVLEGCEELICRVLRVKKRTIYYSEGATVACIPWSTLIKVLRNYHKLKVLLTFVEHIYSAVFNNMLLFQCLCSYTSDSLADRWRPQENSNPFYRDSYQYLGHVLGTHSQIKRNKLLLSLLTYIKTR